MNELAFLVLSAGLGGWYWWRKGDGDVYALVVAVLVAALVVGMAFKLLGGGDNFLP